MQKKFLDSAEQPFSSDEIYLQLQKIVQDPILENSIILKNFLQYIVEQSIQGNSNRLKEYTIAVNVLHKPVHFNTQENGIVRIHAARLRRLLDVYYRGHGVIDFIRISIPKGTYVPHFSKNTNGHLFRDPASVREPVVIGVIPFTYLSGEEADRVVLNGIEIHLTTALMEFENVFVVGFQIISEILGKEKDIKKLISDYGMHYIVMGEVNVVKDTLRLFVHLIKSRSHQQVWAQMYERRIVNDNYFEIQDEVVSSVLPQLAHFLA